MTIKLSTEELAAELERRRHQEQQDQKAKARALHEKQNGYYRGVLAKYPALEEQLRNEGEAHQAAAREALNTLDLNAAFASFTKWKATRITRSEIRNTADAAQQRLGVVGTIHHLGDTSQTFTEWLHLETSGSQRPEVVLADGVTESLLGEFPTSYEDED